MPHHLVALDKRIIRSACPSEVLTAMSPEGSDPTNWVLSPAERAKGFIRPVRHSYVHACGVVTHIGTILAETYARNPSFNGTTFCVGCRAHFPIDQFVWEGTHEKLGT